jgi:hypothetical protein
MYEEELVERLAVGQKVVEEVSAVPVAPLKVVRVQQLGPFPE